MIFLYVCVVSQVTLYDPMTMKKEHVLEGHSGMLSDFDVHGNLIVTSGYSARLLTFCLPGKK
jgi:PAB-dependent poly(A)-specific ribonuclease subunit 2